MIKSINSNFCHAIFQPMMLKKDKIGSTNSAVLLSFIHQVLHRYKNINIISYVKYYCMGVLKINCEKHDDDIIIKSLSFLQS